MNAYTTIEESKKLLDLGLSSESADMYYFLDPTPVGNIYIPSLIFIEKHLKSRMPEYDKGDIPCWSLTALLNVIDSNGLVYDISNDKNREFAILVYEANYISQEVKFHHTEHSIIDMITWLLENNYIKSNKNE